MPTSRALTVIGIVILSLASGCVTVESPTTLEQPLPTMSAHLPTSTSVPHTATPVHPTATEETLPTVTETAMPTFTSTLEPSPTQSAVEEIKNIEYGSAGKEQMLDVYLPNEVEGLRPVVLMLHEGNGHKEQFISWGKSFAKQGYAAVSSNYRGWPNNSYPQDVSDAFCALAWIHTNAAEYKFDTDHVFVLGHSSGGTLAALLGVVDDPGIYLKTCQHKLPDSNWVQGVITFTGIFDYASAAQNSSGLKSYAEALLGGSQETKLNNWAEASAITWIDGSEPPFLVFHGGGDQNIPPDQSTDFAQSLAAAGVPVELVIVPAADHYQITGSAESVETTLAFLSGLVHDE